MTSLSTRFLAQPREMRLTVITGRGGRGKKRAIRDSKTRLSRYNSVHERLRPYKADDHRLRHRRRFGSRPGHSGWLGPGKPSWDFHYQFVAWRRFAADSLHAGHIPLWNPYTFSGEPFLGGFRFRSALSAQSHLPFPAAEPGDQPVDRGASGLARGWNGAVGGPPGISPTGVSRWSDFFCPSAGPFFPTCTRGTCRTSARWPGRRGFSSGWRNGTAKERPGPSSGPVPQPACSCWPGMCSTLFTPRWPRAWRPL